MDRLLDLAKSEIVSDTRVHLVVDVLLELSQLPLSHVKQFTGVIIFDHKLVNL